MTSAGHDDLADTRAFFAPRAATWDERFPDDDDKFAAAVGRLALRVGSTAIDVGCGTGRALPHLRRAVGATGRVLGLDVTPEMAARASTRGPVVIGDARRLPVRGACVDGVLAAGLVNHLADTIGGLVELARITRPGGRLVLFHPIGRAALAARRGHELADDDFRAEDNLPGVLEPAGWTVVDLDDGPDQYLAMAVRH